MNKPVTKAVFPVAGLGTRFLPATKVVAKEMLPIFDKPLIQLAVEEAFESGIEQCIFVTRRGKSLMIDHFDFSPELERFLELEQEHEKLALVREATSEASRILSVRQQIALGLGHAIQCASPFLKDEAFAVILPDDYVQSTEPCLGQLIEVWQKVGGHVVAVEEVPEDQVSNYGILDIERDDGRLAKACHLIEKPSQAEAPSTLAIIGRYVLDYRILSAIATTKPDHKGEIQLTNALNATLDQIPLHGYRFEGERFDCGQRLGFLEANVARAFARSGRALVLSERLIRRAQAFQSSKREC